MVNKEVEVEGKVAWLSKTKVSFKFNPVDFLDTLVHDSSTSINIFGLVGRCQTKVKWWPQ